MATRPAHYDYLNVIFAIRNDGTFIFIDGHNDLQDLYEFSNEDLYHHFEDYKPKGAEKPGIYQCRLEVQAESSYDHYSGATEWDWDVSFHNVNILMPL